MLCAACGTETPAPFDHCRNCSSPLPLSTDTSASENETIAGSSVTDSISIESPLRVGETFGRYRILKLLGTGGMGQVYHAWDEELGEAVALKVIRGEYARNADADARFKRELSVARQVTHTNVVRIHDLGMVNGVRYISMPFIEGIDLAAMLSEGRLPGDIALSIARQLAAGLAAAHDAGVVHRDLKPNNVMIDRSGHAFLMDFGLARSLEGTELTRTGMLVGTIDYMSPEQAMGENVDHRSDIYSLGLILYELFTGRKPFTGETAMSRLTARLHKAPPDPREMDHDIAPHLSRIILKCLERDKESRYQSVHEITREMEEPRALSRFRVGQWARSARWRAAVAALLLLVSAVAAGYFGFARLRSPRVAAGVSQVALVPAVSLAILPFQNDSGDPALDWLGSSLGEMLGTGVGQSSAVRTVSFARVQQVLRDLRIGNGVSLDTSTLQRVAEFSAADTVVTGRYVRSGGQVHIDATLQDFKHSRSIPLKVAGSEKEVLRVVDDLARVIQEKVALSPDVMKNLRATGFRPSSSSVEAVRSYNAGLQAFRQGNYKEAEEQFAASTGQDPRFALAYSQLALTLYNLGRDVEAERASRQAIQLADAATANERYVIQANHALVVNDTRKAVAAYERLAQASADDPGVQFTLAGLYESSGALDKARAGYSRVLARDPKYVEALLAMGRVEIKRGNARDAIEPLNRGLSVAIQLENDEEKGRILHAIGIAYTRLNKPDDALRYYEEALVMRRKVGQKGGIAATISQIAEAQRTLGLTREALASYDEALALQREIGDRRGQATNLLNFASFLVDRGQNADGLRMLKESLQIHRELDDSGGQALCLNNIGSVYFSIGEFDDALTYFQQALQLREGLGVPGDVAETLHNVAECDAKMGEFEGALSQYMRALDLYRRAGNKQGAAIESYAMGKVFELQARYSAAIQAKGDALKTFRESGERSYWMANILGGYGNALVMAGRGDADKILEEALAVAKSLGNDSLIAQSLNFQGNRLFFAGDAKGARGLYDQALRQALRSTDREQQLVSKFNLARLDVKEGRSQAATTLESIASQAERMGLKPLAAECGLYVGEALLARRSYARARSELEAVISRSEKMGLSGFLAPAHYQLARALEPLGQKAESARHMAEVRRLLDSVRRETGTDAVLKRADLLPLARAASMSPPNLPVATSGPVR